MSTAAIVFFLVLAVAMAVIAARLPSPGTSMPIDEDEFSSDRDAATPSSRNVTAFTQQVGLLIPRSIAESASKAAGVEGLLRRSGNPWGITPTQFTTLRLGAAAFGAVIGLAIPTLGYTINPLIAVAMFSLMGYLLPKVLLDSKWAARRRDIQFGLPEALDLIRIALNAGLTFSNALTEAARHMRPSATRDELILTSDAIRSGQTTVSALADFAARCPTDEVDAFARAVRQGERIGSDISYTLEHQAAEARRNFERAIEVKAQKMMTTLFIPILGLMLPALCIFLFGSAHDSLLTMLL